jgi:hypothetical protein
MAGVIKTKQGITTNGEKGGIFIGDRHRDASGGIPIVVEGGGSALVEDSEPLIIPEAVNNPKKHLFDGKQMTSKEILSEINTKYKGVPIKKKGGLIEKYDKSEVEEFASKAKFKTSKSNDYSYFDIDSDNQIRITKGQKSPMGNRYYVTLHERQEDGFFDGKIFKHNQLATSLKDAKIEAAKIYFNVLREETSTDIDLENSDTDYSNFSDSELKKKLDSKFTSFSESEQIVKELNKRGIKYKQGGSIPVKAGSVIITRNANLDKTTKHNFDGKELTNTEILSEINKSGGGVAFEEGGEINNNYLATIITNDNLLFCEMFNYAISHKELFDKYSNEGHIIKQAQIARVDNLEAIAAYKEQLELYIEERYNESIDWSTTFIPYEILEDKIIISDNIVNTTNGNKYNVRVVDLFSSYEKGGNLTTFAETEIMEIEQNEIADSKLIDLEKGIESETKEHSTTLHKLSEGDINEDEAIVEIVESHLKENPNYYNEKEVEIKPITGVKKENKYYYTANDLGVNESTPIISIGTIIYSDNGLDKWDVEYITDNYLGLKHIIKNPLSTQKESKELSFEQVKDLFNERLIQIHNITNERELNLALSLLKAHIKGETHHSKITKFKEGGELNAKEEAKKFMESLSDNERESLVKEYGKALESIKNTYKEEVEKIETEKSLLQEKRNEIDKELRAGYSTSLLAKYDEVNAEIKELELKLLHAKNIKKAVENNGTISSFSDEKGTINDNIPSFLNVDTSVISFDEETILTDEIPAYIPFINEDTFRQKGYLFDAIRIAKDTYIVAVNGYKEKIGGKLDLSTKKTIGGRDAYTYEHGYILVTLDQLVLLQDYYFTKAKAIKIKEANERNERSLAYYNSTSESSRERILNQKGYYNYLPREVQKKVSREEYEALDLTGKEALYKPYKKYNPERLKSQLDSNSMWTSFHFMYERFLDPTKETVRSTIGKSGVFANPVVWEYWVKFREMMEFKIKDIKIQREVDNEQYKKALETSFGDVNTNDILFAKYGILVKRQDGKVIDAIQVNQIENGWIALQKIYGNISEIAKSDGMKISHTSNTNVFASKAIGVFVPKMKTIAVSAKHGNEMFESIFSHETAHYIDHHLGKLKNKRWATDDYEDKAGVLAFTFRKLMNVKSSSDYYNSTKECFARCMEQYFSVITFGDNAKNVEKPYFLDDNYVSKKNFEETIKPLVEEFLSQTGFGAYVEEKKIEVVEPEVSKEEAINEESDVKLDNIEAEIKEVKEEEKEEPKTKQQEFKEELLRRGLPLQGAEGSSKLLVKALEDRHTALDILDIANKNIREIWSKETGVELPKTQKGTKDAVENYFANNSKDPLVISVKKALVLFNNDYNKLANADWKYLVDNIDEADEEIAKQVINLTKETMKERGIPIVEVQQQPKTKSKKEIIESVLPKSGELKGITNVTVSEDGNSISVGTSTNQTTITVNKLSKEDIQEEIFFAKRILKEAKEFASNYNEEDIKKSRAYTDKEKSDIIKQSKARINNIEKQEKIIIPFFEKHLELLGDVDVKEDSKEDYTANIKYWINHYDKEIASGKKDKETLIKESKEMLVELKKTKPSERFERFYKEKAILEGILKHYEIKKQPTTRKPRVKKSATTAIDNFNKGRSEKSLKADSKRTALPSGKRVSASGKVYYENRPNRADANPKTRLKKGGKI